MGRRLDKPRGARFPPGWGVRRARLPRQHEHRV